MPFRGVQITDRQPERIAVAELRMREEHFTGGVEPFEERGIDLVRSARPETHDAERYGSSSLEFVRGVHPRREQACEPDVFSEPRSNPLSAEMTQDHPQLQSAEPPTELDAGVHQISDFTALRGLEILRRQRE